VTVDPTLRAARPADAEAILVVHVAAIVAHGPSADTDRQVAAWAAKTDGTDRYDDAVADATTESKWSRCGWNGVSEPDRPQVARLPLPSAPGRCRPPSSSPAT